MTFFDFEKSVAELEGKIEELRRLEDGEGLNIADEIMRLQQKLDNQLQVVYRKLTPMQKVQVARHPFRPHFGDYVNALIQDFTPLAGDRVFGDDLAMMGGLGRLGDHRVMIMGHEKGRDTQTRVRHNFGSARPEGYRKAQRLMRMADRFGLPVITLVDTAGAYPGVASEERGQAESIAQSIRTCLDIKVPIISVIIGEGGSGGAIAVAVADRVAMLEHSIYSVISPEGCASILWRSASYSQAAAEALNLTSENLLRLKLIDRVILEPAGGAHRQADVAIKAVGKVLREELETLASMKPDALVAARRARYLAIQG
ncbi:MAG: acetyl-CoA carboxylase carboxyltransferase subunit alpha [Pseudomonadota bacterium]